MKKIPLSIQLEILKKISKKAKLKLEETLRNKELLGVEAKLNDAK